MSCAQEVKNPDVQLLLRTQTLIPPVRAARLFYSVALHLMLTSVTWTGSDRPSWQQGFVHPALFLWLSSPLSRLFSSFLATTPTVMVFLRYGLAFRGLRRVRDRISSLHFSFLPIIRFIRFIGYALILGVDVQNGMPDMQYGLTHLYTYISVQVLQNFEDL